MKIGDSLIDKIGAALAEVDYVAVVLSPEAVESKWVKKELEIAMTREFVAGNVVLLPLLYRDCVMPPFLTGKLYADFRGDKQYVAGLNAIKHRLSLAVPLSKVQGYLAFYNALLQFDRIEAMAIVERNIGHRTLEEIFLDFFIPTLTFALEELQAKRIATTHDRFIKDVSRELILRFGDRAARAPRQEQRIVAVTVDREQFSFGLLMLLQLLREERFFVDQLHGLTDDELIRFVGYTEPAAVFVSCMKHESADAGRVLVQRLAACLSGKIIVAGGPGFTKDREAALAAGATCVPDTLTEGKQEVLMQYENIRSATEES